MKSRARTAIAMFGGAAVLFSAVGCGVGAKSTGSTTTTTTTTTTPSSSSVPTNSPPTDSHEGPPGPPSGCVPHLNC